MQVIILQPSVKKEFRVKTVTQFIIAAFLTVITALPAHADENYPKGIKLDGTS